MLRKKEDVKQKKKSGKNRKENARNNQLIAKRKGMEDWKTPGSYKIKENQIISLCSGQLWHKGYL